MAEAGQRLKGIKTLPDTEKKVICPKCGAENPSHALRCGRCGYPFIDPKKLFLNSEP